VQPGTILGRTAREALAPYGVPVLHTQITQRVAVAEAAGAGRAVFDYAPDSLAASEFTAVARELSREVWKHGRSSEDEDHHPASDAAGGRR
jgi:cellulose biosynthesis protein BcsQ